MLIRQKKVDPPSEDVRWRIVQATMRRNGYERHALIETLHTVQESFGFLDDASLAYVAAITAGAAQPGLWRFYFLPFIQLETGGETHLRHVHRHGVLYQGHLGDAGAHREGI